MSNIIYPNRLEIKKPRSLKLSIKSSLPKIHTAVALLYFLWKSNDMPYSLKYSKQIENSNGIFLELSDDIKEKLINYFNIYKEKLSISENDFLSRVYKNPLLTSQIEAIIVAFELVWKFAKISFTDGKLAFSAERSNIGGKAVRYAKQIEFSNLIDIFDILIQENKEEYELELFKWLLDKDTGVSSETLIKLLTILSDESIYKIPLENNDIDFIMGGLYENLSNENSISIQGCKEPKGSLRILGNILDNRLNFFISGKDKQKLTLSNKVENNFLQNYSKRSLLKFDLQHINLNELIQEEKTETLKSIQFQDFQRLSLPKPFLLLAGISGTGKSHFVREQVIERERKERYQLIAVRPDWHEPSDLLGYVSHLNSPAEYIMTDVLKFIIKAWKTIGNVCKFAKNENDKIVVKGNLNALANIPPYWLCLDEMNLAPVEQYFADYLSVLETRKWIWDGENFEYDTEALLSSTTWSKISDFQQILDVNDELWEYFQKNGIGIPFNLIVAGTVNMDETTHTFSRKVLDRALSFDFSEFYPNEFETFFTPTTKPKLLTYPIYSRLKEGDLDDELVKKSIEFITALNQNFENTPFKLGYRALNELLLSIQAFQAKNDIELQAVWDDFVMTKVLPRIEGDETKVGDVLDRIEAVLKEQLSSIWQLRRPDLWRESTKEPPNSLQIKCRSQAKVEYMKKLLKDRGMVSFW